MMKKRGESGGKEGNEVEMKNERVERIWERIKEERDGAKYEIEYAGLGVALEIIDKVCKEEREMNEEEVYEKLDTLKEENKDSIEKWICENYPIPTNEEPIHETLGDNVVLIISKNEEGLLVVSNRYGSVQIERVKHLEDD